MKLKKVPHFDFWLSSQKYHTLPTDHSEKARVQGAPTGNKVCFDKKKTAVEIHIRKKEILH